MSLEKLIELIKSYNPEAIDEIKKAYDYADKMHEGQLRQSGEPYIIHPLTVAYILAELHADQATVCAGLLHDTLEDTEATEEELTNMFGEEVTKLVNGVTKISGLNFSTKEELKNANIKKIIMSLQEDVRIIIIKLADRLHNMRTLEFKSEAKQKKISMETLNIYVPIAYYMGSYRIRNELEDISLSYIKPEEYKRISELRNNLIEESKSCLETMHDTIDKLLNDRNIKHELKIRIKNVYGIYKKLEEGEKITDIHDLLKILVNVDNVDNCYLTLGLVHSQYNPLNNKFKDYIYNPKTNMYQSIHTTTFGLENRLVQFQIRTFNMDKVASFGLPTYWDIYKGEARDIMQKELTEKFQFYKSLHQIDKFFNDNAEFVEQLNNELFGKNVYVYTPKGEVIELPIGSTIIDFAYKIHTELGNTMVDAKVNNEKADLGYVLKNGDRVTVITDPTSIPKEEWLDKIKTAKARRRILEKLQKNE